jgi:hypothetical protein
VLSVPHPIKGVHKFEINMIDQQELFVKTLEELNNRIQANDPYNILMAAGLLRKLLIDGENSLIYQINKNEQSIKFHTNVKTPLHIRNPLLFTKEDLIAYSWFAEDGLNPDTADKTRNFNPQHLTLKEFLEYVVIYTEGQKITIRYLIEYIANKEGAIHRQKKQLHRKDIKSQLLNDLGNSLHIKNLPIGLSTLKTIAIIAHRDLSKLVQQ